MRSDDVAIQEEAKKRRSLVKAPIILDSKEDLGEFQDFAAGLRAHNNVQASKEEAQRLKKHFRAMSRYLKSAIADFSGDSWKKYQLEQLTARKGLSRIFTALAKYTHNTITSDVVILPMDLRNHDFFRKQLGFNSNYKYCGYRFNFGFVQVFEHDVAKINGKGSSIAFPVFLIDERITKAVKDYGRKDLVEGLQAVMTFVNHDMMHHYTTPIINSSVAYDYIEKYKGGAPVYEWESGLQGDYETWAHIVQEKVILHPKNNHLVEEITPRLEKYFSGLQEMGAALISSGKSKQEAHQVVDCLGMLMMHALTRVFPLNHPVTQRCLTLLEQADPAPEEVENDCLTSLSDPERNFKEIKSKMPLEEWVEEIKRAAQYEHRMAKEVIKAYEGQGFHIFPQNGQKMGYLNYKHVQLLAMGGLEAHTPGIQDHTSRYTDVLQKNVKKNTLEMLLAVAKTVKQKF